MLALVVGGGAWWYQQEMKKNAGPQLGQEEGALPQELRPFAHVFVFENLDPNLPEAAREKYFERFTLATNALRQDPTAFNAWLELGKMHKNLNAFEKARDCWVRLGEVSPMNSISFGNLGDLYAWFLHDAPRGEEAYLQAIKNEPDDINFRRNLAEIYAKLMYPDLKNPEHLLKQKEKIVSLLEEAIEKATADIEKAEMAALLGSYFRDWGDNLNAIAWYKKALAIDPQYPNRNILQEEIAKLSQDIKK